MERGGGTQVRVMRGGSKRAGPELIGWEQHCEHGWADEGNAEQVWRQRQTPESTQKRQHRGMILAAALPFQNTLFSTAHLVM